MGSENSHFQPSNGASHYAYLAYWADHLELLDDLNRAMTEAGV